MKIFDEAGFLLETVALLELSLSIETGLFQEGKRLNKQFKLFFLIFLTLSVLFWILYFPFISFWLVYYMIRVVSYIFLTLKMKTFNEFLELFT